MESYSYSYTSSSSSSSIYQRKKTNAKPPPGFLSSLHSVRKHPAKMMKKPIAPLPPTPPKVYMVDYVNFKEVVQKLTGPQDQSQPRRLQEVAPPPLNLSTSAFSDGRDLEGALQLFPSPAETPLSATFREMMTDTLDGKTRNFSESFGALSPLSFSLSPSSLALCSSLLMSPGTLSSCEQGTVL
ncbi:unnamed protein product [Ilex paraguariensis]|uniref:VQ domain-containing protein n=2 Tax=Ilex paraguariensis TaxID=185542 RepID=A0ABC8RFE8_9AQUA